MATAHPGQPSIRGNGDGPMLLHDRVAAHVRALIREGALAPGDRVPSLRAIRRQFGVSMATVTRAYHDLEAAGWIEARPQSGFFVRAAAEAALEAPRPGAPPGAPGRLDTGGLLEALVERDDGTRDRITLSLALPEPDLLPVRALQRSVMRVLRRTPDAASGEIFPPGAPELRRQVARRAALAGAPVDPDEVLVTSGCAEALAIALQCVAGPGDVVAVESPTFFNILTLIEHLGMRALELPTDPADGVDLQALDAALARNDVACALLIPSFSNPLGSCMPDAARRRVTDVAAQRRKPVIEDDIYGDLHFGERRPPALRAFDRDGWILTAASVSKTLAPGYRVGWLMPGAWWERAVAAKHATTMATATLPQLAVADCMGEGGYDRHLRRLRRACERRTATMRAALARHFPSGTRVSDPQGGFQLWVQLPDRRSAADLFERAAAEGIRIAPGHLFGAGATYADYFRLSCGAVVHERAEAAIRRLGVLAAGLAKDATEVNR